MELSIVTTAALTLILGALIGAVLGWLAGAARARAGLAARVAQAETASSLLAERSAALEADATLASELTQAVGPLAAGVKNLQDHVSRHDRERIAEIARLSEHITQLSRQNSELQASTVKLSTALHSSAARGDWGEVQLKRIVEYAGLLPHVDFNTQHSVRTAESTVRPDMIVTIPGGATIVVDAKAPMAKRLQNTDAQSSDMDHARALLRHVDSLASKRYWQAFERTPEFVICFVPTDGLLSAAAAAYPQLIDQAMAKNVVLASPSTLLVLLKTVAMNWRHYDISNSAAQILRLGQELYERTGTLADRVGKVGAALDRAVTEYNSFLGSFESRFLVTARKFPSTGVSAKEIDELTALDSQVRTPSAAELANPGNSRGGRADRLDWAN